MSAWGQGGSRAVRRARVQVLEREGHVCQLMLPGCQGRATEAHHIHGLQGRRRTEAVDPDEMAAVCPNCHSVETEQQRKAAYEAKQTYRNQRRHLPHPIPGRHPEAPVLRP